MTRDTMLLCTKAITTRQSSTSFIHKSSLSFLNKHKWVRLPVHSITRSIFFLWGLVLTSLSFLLQNYDGDKDIELESDFNLHRGMTNLRYIYRGANKVHDEVSDELCLALNNEEFIKTSLETSDYSEALKEHNEKFQQVVDSSTGMENISISL